MNARTAAPVRSAQIVAKVVRVENVFDDPDEVLGLLRSRAPFSLIYGKEGYEKSGGAEPWFRDWWVSDGEVKVPGAERFLHNAKLVAGAREAFDATIVRPRGMTWNILGPMIAGRPHLDVSPYRGIDASWPFWLHVVVHNSQLFTPWAAMSTTGLVLFYGGDQGGFECWPDGPDRPSLKTEPPFWNLGLVTDNEFMFHRPMAVGPPEARILPGGIGGEAKLHRAPDGEIWRVIDDAGVRATWTPDILRYSLVWKATVFRTQADADVYDNHSDDLTHDIVWQVVGEDLRARGSKLAIPKDPMTDRAFRRALLQQQYPNPGTRHFADAKRELS